MALGPTWGRGPGVRAGQGAQPASLRGSGGSVGSRLLGQVDRSGPGAGSPEEIGEPGRNRGAQKKSGSLEEIGEPGGNGQSESRQVNGFLFSVKLRAGSEHRGPPVSSKAGSGTGPSGCAQTCAESMGEGEDADEYKPAPRM